MRVLVAGDRGYIGAVLVPFLRSSGHKVEELGLIYDDLTSSRFVRLRRIRELLATSIVDESSLRRRAPGYAIPDAAEAG